MRYQCVRQLDETDCGAACLATVLRHYGTRIPIAHIREAAGTDRQGTSAYGVVQAARKLGFDAKGVKGDREALFSDFPLPAVAHLVMEDSLLHYVVIHEITEKRITVADPARGVMHYTPDEFCKWWSGVIILLTPGEQFEKKNKMPGMSRRFWGLLLSQKKVLWPIFLLSLLITGAGIAASFYYMLIMDQILPDDPKALLLPVSLGVLGLYLVKNLLDYLRNRLLLLLTQRIDFSLIPAYNRHVLRLPMRFFGTRKTGEIISRYTDAAKIRDIVAQTALSLMIDTLMAIAGGVVLYLANPTLFLFALGTLLLYGVVVVLYNRPIRRANEGLMERNAMYYSYLYESVDGIETIKSTGSEPYSETKSKGLYEKFWESVRKNYLLMVGQGTLTQTIAAVGETLILWFGTTEVLRGAMSIGTLITFHALLAYFLQPVKNLLSLQPTAQSAIVAAQRLADVMDIPQEPVEESGPEQVDFRQALAFSHVSFRYGTRELVLQDVSLSIAPGERIALVGRSGGGKTTLAKLLLRFYEQESGAITIGGKDIRQIPLSHLRNRIAYISQNTFLFSGTIRENLLLANRDATEEELRRACELSQVEEFVARMPLGYETRLDENGANLSGGQRQRLAIARALLQKPDILIMDEATSNLDTVTERAIEHTLRLLSERITTIVIAHRLSTVRQCDRIFVVENGRVLEQGSHDELIGRDGVYARLWRDQFGDEE